MKYYFYSDKTKVRKGQEYYTVYEVEAVKGDVDIADRRAKTKASQRKDKLAGGYFNKKSLPYNFKTNYRVIKVPLSTRVSPYTKKDLFIQGLIEAEANMEYEII